MVRPLVVSSLGVFWLACAAAPSSPANLIPGEGDGRGVVGLERLEGTGAYVTGAVERFRLHADPAVVSRFEWTASGGALSTSDGVAEWTLPAPGTATLALELTHRDGTKGRLTWAFEISRGATGPQTAQQALLATPMPVLDGGTLEVSGGACDVKYEGTTSNVAIAFTTATHPSLMYGRWNGSSWALELVDAMGFNVGGVVRQHVHMQVGAGGTPHLAYVKDNQVWYATKVSGNWVRERADSAALPLTTSFVNSNDDERSNPSIVLGAGGQPVILYPSGGAYSSTNRIRPVLSSRSAAGTWTQASALPAALSSSYNQLPTGDLVLDGASRLVFPVDGYDASLGNITAFIAVGSASTSHIVVTNFQSGVPLDAAVVSGTRVLWRGASGVLDMNLNATFSATTTTFSSIEESLSSFAGDIAWAGTRPVVLHQHSNSVELVTTNASGFWTYTQHGTTSGVTASLAVHPTSFDVSVCYQAGGRIMFQ